jgi:hypothetical protein
MHLVRTTALVGPLLLLLCACASNVMRTGEDVAKGVQDAAMTPLKDVGLIRPEIPTELAAIRYPYGMPPSCEAIHAEIAQLDQLLGEESFQPGKQHSLYERFDEEASKAVVDVAVDTAQGYANVIPFRSWVRRISGATKAERDAARAFELGHARRTYLRGFGAGRGCADVLPAPPPPEKPAEKKD